MRLRRGLTLEQLSEMTSVSSVTIYNIERGVHEPKVSTLMDICKALDLPLNFFMVDRDNWLFHHISAENPSRKLSGVHKKPWRQLPQITRIELDAGSKNEISGDAGEIISLYNVFGRLEVTDSKHSAQLLPGDLLHFEPFAPLEISALETSLCIMIRELYDPSRK